MTTQNYEDRLEKEQIVNILESFGGGGVGGQESSLSARQAKTTTLRNASK